MRAFAVFASVPMFVKTKYKRSLTRLGGDEEVEMIGQVSAVVTSALRRPVVRSLQMLFACGVVLVPPASQAQSLKSDEILSSLSVQPISEPNPVLGSDGRVHLAYELFIANPSRLFVTLDRIEAVNEGGTNLWSVEGDRLLALTQQFGGAGRRLSPGGTAVVFMDIDFARADKVPATVSARVTATRQLAGADGKPATFPADEPVPATFGFDAGSTAVGKPAVVLESPLRGAGWVAVNGCCDGISSHRGAIMAVNGLLRVPERFAIDWVQLDQTGRIFTGDASKLSSYAYYGTPIHAAADGVVVNLFDGADEQAPNASAKGITTETIGGNMVVTDIGKGAFAFYGHLQRDSLKVKLGDRVKAGQIVGLLGNTGNSTAPHLHFHVMDGPSPLDANGLPFVFTHFSSRGVLAAGTADSVEQGQPADITPRLAGDHASQMPMNDEVVNFDGSVD